MAIKANILIYINWKINRVNLKLDSQCFPTPIPVFNKIQTVDDNRDLLNTEVLSLLKMRRYLKNSDFDNNFCLPLNVSNDILSLPYFEIKAWGQWAFYTWNKIKYICNGEIILRSHSFKSESN